MMLASRNLEDYEVQQIKLTLDADSTNEILLDFDANESVRQTGVTTYKIVPAIRTIDATATGSISGDTNNTTMSYMTATSVTGTKYSTDVNSVGNFKLRGLPAGSYVLTITRILPMTLVS